MSHIEDWSDVHDFVKAKVITLITEGVKELLTVTKTKVIIVTVEVTNDTSSSLSSRLTCIVSYV